MALKFLAYATILAMFVTQTQSIIVPMDAKLIDETCKQTKDYAECLKRLNSDPRSLGEDVKGLALILVDQLKYETIQDLEYIMKIREQIPELKQYLDACDRKYDVILTANVPVAIEALQKGNPKFAEGGMNDASLEATSCEEGFPSGRSPLTSANKVLNIISSIASDIIKLLL